MEVVLHVKYHGLLMPVICALKLFASKLMIHRVILDVFCMAKIVTKFKKEEPGVYNLDSDALTLVVG